MITMPWYSWVLIAVIWIVVVWQLLKPSRFGVKQDPKVITAIGMMLSAGQSVTPGMVDMLKKEEGVTTPKMRRPFTRDKGECPRCGTKSEQILICPMCGDPGCVEQCIPGGKDTTCVQCGEELDEFK